MDNHTPFNKGTVVTTDLATLALLMPPGITVEATDELRMVRDGSFTPWLKVGDKAIIELTEVELAGKSFSINSVPMEDQHFMDLRRVNREVLLSYAAQIAANVSEGEPAAA